VERCATRGVAATLGGADVSRLFVPTAGTSDWRRLLADSDSQWRAARPAFEVAVAWEGARLTERGLPPSAEELFDASYAFRGASLLMGIPEHDIRITDRQHGTKADFWALLDATVGVTSMAVEATSGETLHRSAREWLEIATLDGARGARLDRLCELLDMTRNEALDCSYQLLQRTAAAIAEARRFRLQNAFLLLYVLGDHAAPLAAYQHFLRVLGGDGGKDEVVGVGRRGGVDLWLGWLSGEPASDAVVRSAV